MNTVVMKKATNSVEVFVDGVRQDYVVDVSVGWSKELQGMAVSIERRPPGKIEVVKFVADSISYS